jgi:hypothetical protein
MLEELDEPSVGQRVEEAPNVTIQHVVHALPREGHRERVQRLVWTASWPKPVGEAPKILLVDLGEDRDHGLLDNLIFQRRDPQGALSPIGLRDVNPPRGLRPIAPAVNPAVEIGEPSIQAGLIHLPRHAIYPRSDMSLQLVEAVPKQIDREMVE